MSSCRFRSPGELLGLASVGTLALALRLPSLDTFTVSLPEGIRVEQLSLMSAGYQACQDVFCNQGPLALQVMYPTFVAFGQTLAAARSSAIIASLIGLLAVYGIARALWGRTVAVFAALLLALSPTYLKSSRLALPELIALAPGLLAIWGAVAYSRGGRLIWLLTAAGLYAFSLLIKPVAAPAIVPIVLLCYGRPRMRRRDVLLAAGVGLGVVALGLLVVGLPRIWEQVLFRWQSRLAEGRGGDWNAVLIYEELSQDRLGLFALALAGVALLARVNRRALLVVVGWVLASLLLLLVHTPLRDKHVVIMLPPIALLAGYGSSAIATLLPAVTRRPFKWPLATLAFSIVAATVYLITLPALARRDTVLALGSEPLEHDPGQLWYAEASAALSATTRPDDFVVTDFPYIAFSAKRLVPPQLVESSMTRIRAGSLTDEVAIAEASRFDPQAVLLWWDRLARLPGFKRWVDQRFRVARVFAADHEAVTSLYLPTNSDLATVRARLASGAPNPAGARFGNGLLLQSWGLDSSEAAPGERRSLTVLWQATESLGPDLSAVLMLRTPEQIVWTSQRLPLLGNGDGLSGWAPGRWIVWSGLVAIPTKLSGTYGLSIRVVDGEANDYLPVRTPSPRQPLVADDPKGLELAVIEVGGAAVRKRA